MRGKTAEEQGSTAEMGPKLESGDKERGRGKDQTMDGKKNKYQICGKGDLSSPKERRACFYMVL